MPQTPDLVVSGINYGENLGNMISCSGTVGAALEATSHGVAALAVSKQTDIASHHNVVASNRFRVTFQTNRYSVPAEYASTRLTLKAYPDRVEAARRSTIGSRSVSLMLSI